MDEPKIKSLDPEVVARIAAGEVVQSPESVIKELIENSVDAKATSIIISVKDGGLKRIHITDNGCGINKIDFPDVCKRFATSKLRTFDDLKTIATHGFRGEALSSMSQVSHVTVISKTANSKFGYKANYEASIMVNEPVPHTIPNGTQIIIDDLFYSDPHRLKMLADSPNRLFSKITDLVTKYAIHYSGIGITLKRLEDNKVAVKTMSNSSVKDNLKLFYGQKAHDALMEINIDNGVHNYKLKGYATDTEFMRNSTLMMLFVNNRLVTHDGMKKEVEEVYRTVVKDTLPIIYLKLDMNPNNVDVNVHPSKQYVCFLYEEPIIKSLRAHLEQLLQSQIKTQSYSVQTQNELSRKNTNQQEGSMENKVYDHKKVRTDCKDQTLEKFFGSSTVSKSKHCELEDIPTCTPKQSEPKVEKTGKHVKRREFKLTSLSSLRSGVENGVCEEYKKLLNEAIVVGVVNRRYAVLQSGINLILSDTYSLSQEFFYQKILADFGNFPYWDISESNFLLEDMMKLFIEKEEKNPLQVDTLAKKYKNIVAQRADLLYDYFAIKIENGILLALPRIFNDLKPKLGFLPKFLNNLAVLVDWTEEKECLHGISKALASFYAAPFFLPVGTHNNDLQDDTAVSSLSWTIKHVLYQEMQKGFYPQKELKAKNALKELTSVTKLYNTFERC